MAIIQTSSGSEIVISNTQSTVSIFTASGSTSGVSVSGTQIVAPSANASFKVYAISLASTGIVNIAPRFTNGAGTGPTEFWRTALVNTAGLSSRVNFAVTPPGFFFATGVSTTLALVLDSASLVHYSISYIKESA